jgi:D-alanyl-D-alanine carboxypeptidase
VHRPFVVAALLILAVALPAAQAREASRLPSLRPLVAAGAPGAILLTAHGDAITRRALGSNDVRRRTVLRAGDSFRIGSLTKSYVAAVVLQLTEEGRLSLDDPVARYLPGVVPGAGEITIRDVLAHMSGLPEFDALPAVLAPYLAGNLGYVWAPRDLIDLAVAQPATSAPGTAFAYSNTNYLVAGLLVEAVTGKPLETVLRSRIFGPLHLRHTVFALAGDAPRPRAHGYTIPAGAGRVDVTTLTPYSWAAGAIVSTTVDVAAYYRALLAGRVVAPAELRAMLTTVDDPHGDFPGQGYGLGIARFPTRCGVAWGHNGDTPGYVVYALSSRNGRRQAVLLVNEDAESLPRGTGRVFIDVLTRAYCATRR